MNRIEPRRAFLLVDEVTAEHSDRYQNRAAAQVPTETHPRLMICLR